MIKIFRWYNESLKQYVTSSRMTKDVMLYHYNNINDDIDVIYDKPNNRYTVRALKQS